MKQSESTGISRRRLFGMAGLVCRSGAVRPAPLLRRDWSGYRADYDRRGSQGTRSSSIPCAATFRFLKAPAATSPS